MWKIINNHIEVTYISHYHAAIIAYHINQINNATNHLGYNRSLLPSSICLLREVFFLKQFPNIKKEDRVLRSSSRVYHKRAAAAESTSLQVVSHCTTCEVDTFSRHCLEWSDFIGSNFLLQVARPQAIKDFVIHNQHLELPLKQTKSTAILILGISGRSN